MKKILCVLAMYSYLLIPTAQAETGYLYSIDSLGFVGRSVSLIDPITDSLVTSSFSFIDVTTSPRAITADPTGTIVYMTIRGDSNIVDVIDAQSLEVIQTILVGSAPEAIVASPDGTRLYVADQIDKTVTVIDVTNNYVITAIISLGTTLTGPGGMGISPDSATLYVCNSEDNTISVIDTESNTLTNSILLEEGSWPIFVTLNAEGTKAYVANLDNASVSVIDTASNTVTDTIPVGTQLIESPPGSEPTSIALNPSNHTAYTTNQNDNTISVIDTDLNTEIMTIPSGDSPRKIVIKYDNTKAYVANANDSTIAVLDLDSNEFVDTISMENAPLNLALFYQVTADISPTTLTFSDQNISTASNTQSVTLTNSDGPAVTITNIAITGDFSQSNDCGTQLDTSASCTIDVTFTPSTTGDHTGTLTVTSIDTNSPHTVSLSGTGVEPVVEFSVDSLTFSEQVINTVSTAQVVTLTNTGTGPLEISSITASGDFSQTNTCDTSMAAGDTCTISVVFTPTVIGAHAGTLTITNNASGSPHEIGLEGDANAVTISSGGGCSLVTNRKVF